MDLNAISPYPMRKSFHGGGARTYTEELQTLVISTAVLLAAVGSRIGSTV